MACEPENVISSGDLADLKADISTIDEVVESTLDTITTKNGKAIKTLVGQLKLLGYEPPEIYAGSIVFAVNALINKTKKAIDINLIDFFIIYLI